MYYLISTLVCISPCSSNFISTIYKCTFFNSRDGKRGYIQHLAVANAARGQGVAGRLVELCLEALKLQGIEKSHVHVSGDNELGRKFWSGRGWFHRAEIVMYSFINGENKNA